MICPRCASNQGDDIRFCTSCGANLQAVREAMQTADPAAKFDWSNTWVAEMFMSGQAHELRKREMERRLGITPEVKRYNEIKAGVITSMVGIGGSIFLYVFFQGLILNSHVSRDAAVILSNIWVAGIIPIFVGLALITNGLVVSKKLVEIAKRAEEQRTMEGGSPQALRAAPDTNDFSASPFSVTEQTTRHLQSADRK